MMTPTPAAAVLAGVTDRCWGEGAPAARPAPGTKVLADGFKTNSLAFGFSFDLKVEAEAVGGVAADTVGGGGALQRLKEVRDSTPGLVTNSILFC